MFHLSIIVIVVLVYARLMKLSVFFMILIILYIITKINMVKC